jgi:hypothetical protein
MRGMTLTMNRDNNRVVTLRVLRSNGPGYDVPLHKHIACRSSPVLNEVFNRTPDANPKTYCLANASLDAVVLLAYWMYHGDATLPASEDPSFVHENYMMSLIILHVLAGKLQMPILQDCAIINFQMCFERNKSMPRLVPKYVWENTVANSLLRRYVLDLCVTKIHIPSDVLQSVWFPKEMVVEMFAAFKKKVERVDSSASDNMRPAQPSTHIGVMGLPSPNT